MVFLVKYSSFTESTLWGSYQIAYIGITKVCMFLAPIRDAEQIKLISVYTFETNQNFTSQRSAAAPKSLIVFPLVYCERPLLIASSAEKAKF